MLRAACVSFTIASAALACAANASPIPKPLLDTSFGKPAVIIDRPGGLLDLGKALLVQPDGKIVVVAASNGSAPPTLGAAVRRVLPTGLPDAAYGTKVVPLDFEIVTDAVVDQQSNLYIVGLSSGNARAAEPDSGRT